MGYRDRLVDKAQEVIEGVCGVILGKREAIEEIFLAFLANGHILLDDIPGVGKTTLARAFAKSMNLEYKRIQFTPDVMPSDITGYSIYNREKEEFVYQRGSVFCNLLIADEINRTSPKTQSALLEVMEERKVSVEGVTREVPLPFLVIATQNPVGSIGTQRLPEAQSDRFMISLGLGYPDIENERKMAKEVGLGDRVDRIEPILETSDLLSMQEQIHEVFIKDTIYNYIVDLVQETRKEQYLDRGASPRTTIALVKMAKASAWLRGSEYVIPEDVQKQFIYVAKHRVIRSTAAKIENKGIGEILGNILVKVKKPMIGEKI